MLFLCLLICIIAISLLSFYSLKLVEELGLHKLFRYETVASFISELIHVKRWNWNYSNKRQKDNSNTFKIWFWTCNDNLFPLLNACARYYVFWICASCASFATKRWCQTHPRRWYHERFLDGSVIRFHSYLIFTWYFKRWCFVK